jgi:hypothetical protein
VGLFDAVKRSLPEGVVELAEGIEASQAHWGRILSIERTWGGRARIRLEVHHLDNPPAERTATQRIPRDIQPQVGQDVYVTPVRGQFYGVEVPYKIDWSRPPKYGDAPPDMEQRAVNAVFGGMPSLPDPLGYLDALRAEGKISERDYEATRRQITGASPEADPPSEAPA